MASRKNTSSAPTQPKFDSVAEIDRGIEKLRKCLVEIETLDPSSMDFDGPERETAQLNFRDTVHDVFGPNTPQFERYGHHRIWRGPERMRMTPQDRQAGFQKGIPHTKAAIIRLIEWLEEKKIDLERSGSGPDVQSERLDERGDCVFIGHGRSPDWKVLKDFLVDRLGLKVEEFNSKPPAGVPTAQRLQDMLTTATFAFLIMTAEEEHSDGSRHARENVIHELGLFQGRYGFNRAIVLLEEGCSEFSNIVGLTQIRFPKGDILAKSEEYRRVLEREELIKKR